jgi:hypothetical protein
VPQHQAQQQQQQQQQQGVGLQQQHPQQHVAGLGGRVLHQGQPAGAAGQHAVLPPHYPRLSTAAQQPQNRQQQQQQGPVSGNAHVWVAVYRITAATAVAALLGQYHCVCAAGHFLLHDMNHMHAGSCS